MSDTDGADADLEKWDPDLVRRALAMIRPLAKRWFRSEVHGLDRFPPGAALVVSNHSGGALAMDTPLFAIDFCDKFGYDRPIYTLSHDLLVALLAAPGGDALKRAGFIRATRANAAAALRSGGVVVVYPGGDYDACRPTRLQAVIDFNNHTGYVKTALAARVPIVPMVSIGGQETQLFLSRGQWLAKRLGVKRLMRSDILPISIGFPFGLNVMFPINLPLPTKIVTEVLEPIDIVAEFGHDPDVAEVDAHVRKVMQSALDRLASERNLPVLG